MENQEHGHKQDDQDDSLSLSLGVLNVRLTGKLLAGLALGTLIPAAGVGGFLASQLLRPAPSVTQPVAPQDDETVGLGLLRFEDLKQ